MFAGEFFLIIKVIPSCRYKPAYIPGSFNGRTEDSKSSYQGSSPCPGAKSF